MAAFCPHTAELWMCLKLSKPGRNVLYTSLMVDTLSSHNILYTTSLHLNTAFSLHFHFFSFHQFPICPACLDSWLEILVSDLLVVRYRSGPEAGETRNILILFFEVFFPQSHVAYWEVRPSGLWWEGVVMGYVSLSSGMAAVMMREASVMSGLRRLLSAVSEPGAWRTGHMGQTVSSNVSQAYLQLCRWL